MGGTRVRGRAVGWTVNLASRRPDPPAHTGAGEAHGRENSCGSLKECVATKGWRADHCGAARLGLVGPCYQANTEVGWLWWHLFVPAGCGMARSAGCSAAQLMSGLGAGPSNRLRSLRSRSWAVKTPSTRSTCMGATKLNAPVDRQTATATCIASEVSSTLPKQSPFTSSPGRLPARRPGR